MARSKTSLAGLFAHLLAPVADAIRAETDAEAARPGETGSIRRAAGNWLRRLADLFALTAEPVAEPTPVPVAVGSPAVIAPPAAPAAAPGVVAEPAPRKPGRKRKSRAAVEPKAPVPAVRATKKPAAKKRGVGTARRPTKKPPKGPTARGRTRKGAKSAA